MFYDYIIASNCLLGQKDMLKDKQITIIKYAQLIDIFLETKDWVHPVTSRHSAPTSGSKWNQVLKIPMILNVLVSVRGLLFFC